MRKFLLAILLMAFAAPNVHALVLETGTLRGLLLGHCPGCAYDNWESHVVEGVVTPGYNDFGPAWFDPQMNGFGHYTDIPTGTSGDQMLAQWRAVFDACVDTKWNTADSLLALHSSDWYYDLVRLQDTELNRTFYVLRERLDDSFVDTNVDTILTDDVTGSFRNGWGVFVFNPAPLFPKLIVQMPHPEDDFLAIPIGIELFIRTNARALMIAGACREALWTTSSPPYSNSKSLSDPSRNERSPFELCHEALFDHLDGGPTSQFVTVQMHSYDHLGHPAHKDIQMTAFYDDSRPNPPIRDRAEHQDIVNFCGRRPVTGLPGYPTIHAGIGQYMSLQSSPAYSYYGTSDTVAISTYIDLPGYGWNKQAIYSHRGHNVDLDPENFIHVELDEYPDSLWSPVNWHNWLPGNMPATWETFQLALAYYEPFIAATDSALRFSHLYADDTPPATVRLTQATYYAADSVKLVWTPSATDRFFDTYQIFYDTVAIRPTSPYYTRTRSGLGSLQDFATTSAVIKNMSLPATRYRFAVGSRDIYGNVAERSNPSNKTGGNLGFTLADEYLGWESACRSDTMFVTFSESAFRTGRFFVILPPDLEAAWGTGTQSVSVLPSYNAANRLVLAIARRSGTSSSDTIEVNVQWSPPYSDGNSSRYIAAIPIRNQSAGSTTSLTISGGDSSFFHDGNGDHINDMYIGSATIYVDATAPVATLSYVLTPECALGNSAALRGILSANVLRGAVPANAPLVRGYLELDGDSTRRISLFTGDLPGDFATGAFPDSAQSVALWNDLNEDCNHLVIHSFDSECNEGVSSSLPLVKDATAPSLTAISRPFCYTPGNYLTLRDSLDITAQLGTDCVANAGNLSLWYDSDPDTFVRSLDVTNFPDADSQAVALWTWIVNESGAPPTANGETYAFHVRAADCAGNAKDTTFTLNLDLTCPLNTVITFNAQPAHQGVWLKWQWDSNTLPSNAVAMEIWRSPFESGDYPSYDTPNPDRWQNLSDSTFYPRAYPPVGWTRVTHQNGVSGVSSQVYAGINGKGECFHALEDPTYWLDSDSLWSDTSSRRDIYRYVTFVQDAAGNWSHDSSFTLNKDADRSTNYWLGDFVPADTSGTEASCGRINSEDLIALSAHYFTVTDPSWSYLDIGPEHRENAFGKGLPIPDHQIDFFDLLPFSDNYGVVAPVGYAGELRLPRLPNVRRPVKELDDGPAVVAARTSGGYIPVGTEFSIDLRLVGNVAPRLRIVEAELSYDPEILEVVRVSAAPSEALDGIPFSKSAVVEGRKGTVGAVAAAIGTDAFISGDLVLSTVTFRWLNIHAGSTRLELGSVRMASVSGQVTLGVGNTVDLNASGVIPLRYALHQNYPNPFNGVSHIRFDLPAASDVRLVIYNVLGQEVRTLISTHLEAGEQFIVWDSSDETGQAVSSGIYICRMTAGPYTGTMKMLLLR